MRNLLYIVHHAPMIIILWPVHLSTHPISLDIGWFALWELHSASMSVQNIWLWKSENTSNMYVHYLFCRKLLLGSCSPLLPEKPSVSLLLPAINGRYCDCTGLESMILKAAGIA